MNEYSLAKTGNIRVIFPTFQNCANFEKYLRDNKHNSLHLSPTETDNVHGQIAEYILSPNDGHSIMYGPRFKSWEGEYEFY